MRLQIIHISTTRPSLSLVVFWKAGFKVIQWLLTALSVFLIARGSNPISGAELISVYCRHIMAEVAQILRHF